jgi:hypothetical protein
LESRLHALEMGTRKVGHSVGVLHPAVPAPVQERSLGMQAQIDGILERLHDQDSQILRLEEANVAQTNTIAMLRSAMASDVCEVGGESFD